MSLVSAIAKSVMNQALMLEGSGMPKANVALSSSTVIRFIFIYLEKSLKKVK